ncbi:TIGR01212 family radical SAM protein [Acetobacterium sp.]|uniref:TIGR01212 family radical SAM protein n=1 Tax=Acetobacterium sp. TaxID=1872094 RepID=UPI0035936ECC
MTEKLYNIYSVWLKERYGEKVYKIPVNIPVTCPNRDGTKGTRGCVYCGAKGGGNETLSDQLSVREQVERNIAYIGKRYHAKKFIPYFQSFSNTYCEFSDFRKWILESIRPDVVEISVSTRPDCITDEQLKFLETVKKEQSIEVTIELGLQSVNEETLRIINRGHTLADYEQAIDRIKAAGLLSCTHMILDLPWDREEDVVNGAEILSRKKTDFVKCHSLYIEKNTVLKKWYEQKKVTLLTKDDYITRAILFLEHLDPKIVVQRLIGRAPKEDSVITNWNISWWKIKDELEAQMTQENNYQGRKFSGMNNKR